MSNEYEIMGHAVPENGGWIELHKKRMGDGSAIYSIWVYARDGNLDIELPLRSPSERAAHETFHQITDDVANIVNCTITKEDG